jgi:hypothetical protein
MHFLRTVAQLLSTDVPIAELWPRCAAPTQPGRNAGFRSASRAQIIDPQRFREEIVHTRVAIGSKHIANLRQKIHDDPSRPRYIVTVPGVGYKLAR